MIGLNVFFEKNIFLEKTGNMDSQTFVLYVLSTGNVVWRQFEKVIRKSVGGVL
jgi:hypothetical protein